MELSKVEFEMIESAINERAAESDLVSIELAKLALVGGGCGDVQF